MDNMPSVYEWFDQCEGRASEGSRRLTFLVLFTEEGRPRYWLIGLAMVAAAVIGVDLGH